MFDDQTEIRHERSHKQLWRAAAAVAKKQLSTWVRDTLTDVANDTLRDLPRCRCLPRRKK